MTVASPSSDSKNRSNGSTLEIMRHTIAMEIVIYRINDNLGYGRDLCQVLFGTEIQRKRGVNPMSMVGRSSSTERLIRFYR